jgi:hypothetical protein
MNNTLGGINPSGYYGSGYGFAQNRLAMPVPLPPMPQRPPSEGLPPWEPGRLPVPPMPQRPPSEGLPPLGPGGLPVRTPTPSAPIPWWGKLGFPAFHFPSSSAPPLGVLGIQFGRTNSGGWSPV